MSPRTVPFVLLLALGSLMHCPEAANIVEEAGGGRLEIVEQKSYYRPLVRYRGESVDTLRLHCEFFRYCEPRAMLPLLGMFVMWNGTIAGTEQVRQYEEAGNDPWIGVVILPETPEGEAANTHNWYWGNVWTDSVGQRWSRPWCHNAVVDLFNDLKYTDLIDSIFPGVTLDTNRFYGMGTSIGGTAANQICIRHPEIFAAFHGHSGWTTFRGVDNNFFSDHRGCLAMAHLIGGVSHGDYCEVDSSVLVHVNDDQRHLGAGDTTYIAADYTDLGWYFGRSGDGWNCRTPAFPAPYAFMTTGARDDPAYQGDNLQPVLEETRRGYTYNRVDAGHAAGGIWIRWHWLRRFRRDQSYLVLTNRNYGVNSTDEIGMFNDLSVHGWDPESIIDEPDRYRVTLTGEGTADITLRRLQRLDHRPGTRYDVTIDDEPRGTVTADEYGLIVIPEVSGAVTVELNVSSTLAGGRPRTPARLRRLVGGSGLMVRGRGTGRAYSLRGRLMPGGAPSASVPHVSAERHKHDNH